MISLQKYDILLIGDKRMQKKKNKTNNLDMEFIKNKKNIIIIVVIILVIFTCIKINRRNLVEKDGLIYNSNKSFTKEQKVKGIVFKNIKCTYDGQNSLISYIMVNDTKEKIDLKNYDVYVKDKNNVILTKIAANVTQTLLPKKEVEMANQVIGVDLTNDYYLELKLRIK